MTKTVRVVLLAALTSALLGIGIGCSQRDKNPDVKSAVERALSDSGLSDVKVSQDRDKGVITLSGTVQSDNDKKRAEDTAKTVAESYVLANEIGVRPAGFESEAKKIDSNLDDAIEKEFEAALVSKQLNKGVKGEAKNGVLTLTGEVNSEKKRKDLETLASSVPNVKQVVNEVQVKGQKATSRG